MSKISFEDENPFDVLLIKLSEVVSPYIREYTSLTPNGITTLSTICGIISLYFLHIKQIFLFSIFFILFYFFDVLDGYFARKYTF